jgi:hypothetical protein
MSKDFWEILVNAWHGVHNLVGEVALLSPSGNHGDVAMQFQGFSGLTEPVCRVRSRT